MPRSASEETERKVATMLFADIVGFTSLGEQYDPELIRSVVAPAFDRLVAEIRRHEGMVEKFQGDAILAVFGVPVTHEDDAERAVRAALAMQALMNDIERNSRTSAVPTLMLRIGLEMGEVLVDLARVERERDRMVTGDAVNLAARLQQLASPGAVVVGPGVHAATRDVVTYQMLDPGAVKGKDEPITVWRAVAVASSRQRRSPFGRETPFVGRDRELTMLKETVAAVMSDRRAQLLTILGSAGIGKSRLAWELEKYVGRVGEPPTWRKGRCLAYGQSSYSALAGALKADVGILDDDSPEDATAKLDARLERLGLSGVGGPVRQALRAALALDTSERLPRESLFESWRRYLERVATERPLVLVLEDLHWADEGLLDFVEFLATWADAPIAIVGLARHELLERRPAWTGDLKNATTLVVQPLSAQEAGSLISALIGPVSSPLLARLDASSEGNPLFIEELTRLSLDAGSTVSDRLPLEVPQSIHALLAARLDTLSRPERNVARDASVVGRFFWDGALAQLGGVAPTRVDQLLRGLQEKDLIVGRDSALSGEAEYAFRHVLIRDVAYDTIPKRQRAVKHRRVAEWAERRFAERLDEAVEHIASHYASALAYEEELPSSDPSEVDALRRKTYDFARRAADRANELWQMEAASHWMRIVVEQARHLSVPTLELVRCIIDYFDTDTAGLAPRAWYFAAKAEANRLLEALSDRSTEAENLRARFAMWDAMHQFVEGDLHGARDTLSRALSRIEGGPPTGARALLLARLGRQYLLLNQADRARDILKRALDEARVTGQAEAERWAIHDMGMARPETETAMALEEVEHSMALAKAAGDRLLYMRGFGNLPWRILATGGDWYRAIAVAREGIAEAKRMGYRSAAVNWPGTVAAIQTWLGPVDEAVEQLEITLRGLEEIDFNVDVPGRYLDLAFGRLGLGDQRGAREAFECAVAAQPTADHLDLRAPMDRARAEALLEWRDDPRRAVHLFAGVLRQASEQDGIGHNARWLVRMAVRTGQTAEGKIGLDRIRAADELASTQLRSLWRRWANALLVEPPSDAAAHVEAVADELRSMDYALPAADAMSDAALMAARAGSPSDQLIGAAMDLYAEAQAVPILGELPETGWIGAPPPPRAGSTTETRRR